MSLHRWSSSAERQLYYQSLEVAVVLMVSSSFADSFSLFNDMQRLAEENDFQTLFPMLFLLHALTLRDTILAPIMDTYY